MHKYKIKKEKKLTKKNQNIFTFCSKVMLYVRTEEQRRRNIIAIHQTNKIQDKQMNVKRTKTKTKHSIT